MFVADFICQDISVINPTKQYCWRINKLYCVSQREDVGASQPGYSPGECEGGVTQYRFVCFNFLSLKFIRAGSCSVFVFTRFIFNVSQLLPNDKSYSTLTRLLSLCLI